MTLHDPRERSERRETQHLLAEEAVSVLIVREESSSHGGCGEGASYWHATHTSIINSYSTDVAKH